MFNLTKQLLIAIIIFFSLLPAANARSLQDEDKLSLQLLWKHQFQFAGYYVAKEKGFYQDVGLNVEIREFDNSVNLVNDVLEGKADFAVGRSSLLVNKAAGDDIVALFAAFQKSPLMLLTKKSGNINKPGDLRGRKIMITQDAKRVAELMAMLLQAGLREEDFIRQPHSFNVQDLIDNNTEAMASYLSNEPFQLTQQGIPYQVLHPADYGFDMYTDILFSARKTVSEQPDLTYRFYEASLKGWLYAFDNIEETVDLILKHYNSQSRSREAAKHYSLKLMP
ncbi:MAG: ABC transporter substrate-binding protein [Pontibacterium sp.]